MKTRWGLLFSGVLILVLLRVQPWNCLVGYDQAKQAYVSLEMVQEGHGWYQHLPTGKPATKPPLAGWLSSAIYPLVGGGWESAWRLPSLLAFCGILLILGKWGGRIGGEWGAFLAISVFAVNMFSIRIAALVRTDMLLALLIFLGGGMVWRQLREASPWSPVRRVAFALVVLAACFTKGPVILAYLLVPLLVWRVVCWRRHEPSFAWPGWGPWLVPISLFVLWLAIGCARDEQFFKMVVVKEFGTNFAAISVTDNGNITVGSRRFGAMLTYPLQLLHRLFPWSLVALAWVIVDRQGRRRLMEDAGARWLVVWTGVALLLMSFVPNKRADRIFPIVAPFALLMAHGVVACQWCDRWRLGRIIGVLTIGAFLVWGSYTVYWQLDTRNQEKNEELARYEMCREAIRFARSAKKDLSIVGPISDRNQSLLTYLRCTTPLVRGEVENALQAGGAVLMPLTEADQTNRLWRIVFLTEKVVEDGSGYGLLVRPEQP